MTLKEKDEIRKRYDALCQEWNELDEDRRLVDHDIFEMEQKYDFLTKQ